MSFDFGFGYKVQGLKEVFGMLVENCSTLAAECPASSPGSMLVVPCLEHLQCGRRCCHWQRGCPPVGLPHLQHAAGGREAQQNAQGVAAGT